VRPPSGRTGRPHKAGAATCGAACAASITEKTAKRFYPFDFSLSPISAFSALVSGSRPFPLSISGIFRITRQLSSGAALVQAAPLFRQLAASAFSQRRSTKAAGASPRPQHEKNAKRFSPFDFFYRLSASFCFSQRLSPILPSLISIFHT
jgi:hypothetical protein